jgi:hypothetical protein
VSALAAAGYFFGASMSYGGPVGVTMSVHWWGIYFGFFGWSISAWIGFLTERPPVPPALDSIDKGEPSVKVDSPVLPAGYSALVHGANEEALRNPTFKTMGVTSAAPTGSRATRPLLEPHDSLPILGAAQAYTSEARRNQQREGPES